MFLVRLVTAGGSLMFDPPLDTIEQGVLQAFDAIVLRSANVDEITTKVDIMKALFRLNTERDNLRPCLGFPLALPACLEALLPQAKLYVVPQFLASPQSCLFLHPVMCCVVECNRLLEQFLTGSCVV